MNCKNSKCDNKITYEMLLRHPNRVFCSKDCYGESTKAEYKRSRINVKTSTLGAINELKVATDLMSKKYNVFRALDPSCKYDFIIEKDGNISKLQVKTGRRNQKNKLCFPKDKYDADITAVVIDNEIIYINKA